MGELLGVYAAKHKNSDIRAASRSGGVFSALSDYIFENNGVVFGCVLSDDFLAYHVKASTKEERDAMRGSKYIQSNMGNTFKEVKKELDTGKLVLFSGTSCQVDGLKHFLVKDYNNLICVDIVCHGVPSPKVWKAFLKWQENRTHNKIIAVDFRNKTDFGWASHTETLFSVDGEKIHSDIWKTIFSSCNAHRPYCYNCKYKSITHPSDITIGDYWGIDNALPGFNDNKGISLVLINSEKGKDLYNKILDHLDSFTTEIEKSLQPALQHPFPKPNSREQFWEDFKTKEFTYIAKKYGGLESKAHKFIKKCLNKTKRIIKKVLGK